MLYILLVNEQCSWSGLNGEAPLEHQAPTSTIDVRSPLCAQLMLSQCTSAKISRVPACCPIKERAPGVSEGHLASSNACSCAIDLHISQFNSLQIMSTFPLLTDFSRDAGAKMYQ